MIYDPNAAQLALAVMRAEDLLRSEQTLNPPLDNATAGAWELQGHLIGNDVVVDIDPKEQRKTLRMLRNSIFYGYVAQSKENPEQYVAVIRGTGNAVEWLINGQFAPIPHHIAGHAEQGFYDLYQSLYYQPMAGTGGNSGSAATDIACSITTGKLTVVGHSLGSALATYLTFDLAAGNPGMGDRVTACLFASPRAGDIAFADMFHQRVSAYKLYNYSRDAVPTVPLLFGYTSLPGMTRIVPEEAQAKIRFDPLLPLELHNLACQHHAVCYAAMLDYHAADWANLPMVDGNCAACIIGSQE